MTRRIFGVAAAAVFAAASSASAVDETTTSVDVETGSAADVRGTLAGETDVFRFTAAAGATLTFRVTASPARSLRFDVRVVAPSGAELPIVGVPRSVNRPGLASLSRFALPESGRYSLRVGGTGAGTYRLTWTTGPGADRPEKLDFRGVALGRASGYETAVGRPVAAGAPTSLTVASTSDLVGASLVVPADAAPDGARVLLTSTTAPRVSDAGRHAAGPALAVAPDGMVLSSAATLTVPYDPFLVPRGADPAAVLSVARVASDGTSVALVPVSVDAQSHTVTVTTDRFARFVATSSTGLLDPTGKSYWRASLDASFKPDAGGDGTTARDVDLQAGRATFEDGGTMPLSGLQYSGHWLHDVSGAVVAGATGGRSDVVSSWSFAPDGRRIQVDDVVHGTSLFEMSENGQALVGQLDGRTTRPSCRIDVALLRAERAPTMSDLAGAWRFGMVELDMTWSDDGRPLGLEVDRSLGTLNLRADGTWTITVDSRGARFARKTRRLGRTAFDGALGGGWSVVGSDGGWAEGSVMLTIPTPIDTVIINVLPSADGRSFVGCTNSDLGLETFAFLFGVRKSNATTNADAQGEYAATELGLGVTVYRPSGAPRFVPDIVLSQTQARIAFDGSGALALTSGSHLTVERDPSAVGVIRNDSGADDPIASIPFSLTRTGALTVQADPQALVVGAIAPDASTGFVVDSPRTGVGEYGLRVFVKSPPSQ
jgi:hypothetical protein